ncbi:MAG TPA: hypothetical protein VKU02_00025 [Gemmataceae bacterium]|nr:hypothetical protein [Gemmataceae bacterium]
MQSFYTTLTAVAVASIYIGWQRYCDFRMRRDRTIQERVTYMLWMMASQMQ